MIELVRTDLFVLEKYPGRSVLKFTRSSVPITDAVQLDRAFSQLQSALDGAGRARHAFVLDLREGPLRTDPEFDKLFAAHRKRMLLGFARVALVLRTAVGKLQVQRLAAADGTPLTVFDSEEAALAHATVTKPATSER